MKTDILFCALLMLAGQASSQRRGLEADITAIANAATGIISDNPNETTFVKIELMLQHIIDYDPKSSILEISAWLMTAWTDGRFAWKPSDYGNITKISIPCSGVTKPDIKLFNGVRSGLTVDGDVNCIVEHTGEVLYIPITNMKVYCTGDPTADTHVCNIILGSWTHNCNDLNITRGDDMLDLSEYHVSWRFKILEHSSEVREKEYACCPEKYCDAAIKLKFQDRTKTPGSKWYSIHGFK
ncbi:hypothetical protein SNE40_003511 [Patella caerulea]|uniref:Neurotransmitter-gated ion-channel ligand-binding domain-containing protein n=1 Tax=Patella caerulea TaxID=87958 RepID=A0AAN8KED7_PATCE